MQAAKNAVETIKETAANIGASAKSGLEKTKATLQEKSEMMSANDQTQKEMPTQKKEERINHAEMEKQQARVYNAAVKQSAVAGHVKQGHYPAIGPGPTTETATNNPTGLGPEIAVYSNTVPGTETATYNNTTGLRPDNAVLSNTGHGHGHDLAHGLGHKDVVGLHPIETNTGVDTTTQTTLGSALPSGLNLNNN